MKCTSMASITSLASARALAGAAVAVVGISLSGCSTTTPDVIGRSSAGQLSSVADAQVITVRQVVVDGNQSGLGAIAGAVVGGVAGGSVGGRREATAVGALGAVLGGVVGNAVERSATREAAIEIVLQMRNGERRAVVQARGSEDIRPGDAVLVIQQDGRTRVTRANPAQAPR